MSFIGDMLSLVIQVLTFAVFIRAILSWFPIGQGNPLSSITCALTEPILAPIRRLLPRVGTLDLSPIAAIILLQVVSAIISRIF